MSLFIEPPGEPVEVDQLSPIGIAYTSAIRRDPNFNLVETRRHDDACILVVDARAGIPPRSPHGVESVERLAVEVREGAAPVVHALRSGFPHLPHQNMVAAGMPRQLCLSEVPWEEEAATETPARRLNRITEWLERAGWGRLYASDQPLEPYVFSVDRIIVPNDLFQVDEHTLYAVVMEGELLSVRPVDSLPSGIAPKYIVMPITASPTDEQVVHSLPLDFGQLAGLLQPLGVDLVERTRLTTKGLTAADKRHMLELHWLFLVRIPRVTVDRSLESEDVAFLLRGCTVGELGEALGAVMAGAGMTGLDLGDLAGVPRDYKLDLGTPFPLSPVPQLTRSLAARMNGLAATPPAERQVGIVGVGALGSSLALSLARTGQPVGLVMDHDTVLPHNIARYALPPVAIGMNKAECVSLLAAGICSDGVAPQHFADDILTLADDAPALQAMSGMGLVVDCTTSRAALRRLARTTQVQRRSGCYITASGKHLLVMTEGVGSPVRLDDLDVQFSYAAATHPELADAMLPQGGRVRYAGGCSDLSAVLDGHAVGVMANIAASRVQRALDDDAASIRVWHYEPEGPEVSCVTVAPADISTRTFSGGWELRMSQAATAQMAEFRAAKLPNETGGVLLGAFDVPRCTVYVAGVLPSPPDSEEWPTSYIRGSRGLRTQVERISRGSGNEIGYVGEWHSHPAGCVAALSGDDMRALVDLTETMGRQGLPGVVVVLSDEGEWEAGLTFLL